MEAGVLGCLEMMGTGGDRPIRHEGTGGGGSGWGRGEGRRRDGEVEDDRKELKTGDIA